MNTACHAPPAQPDRLQLARVQLLVVDLQERLLPHIHEHAQVLAQAERMLRAAAALGLPFTISEQYTKGLGCTAPAILAAAEAGGLDVHADAGRLPASAAPGAPAQAPSSQGHVLQASEAPVPATARIEKLTFSFCADPSGRERVLALARPQVLLVGIETHVCVQQTALDLLEMGLRPVVLADAVGSRRPLDYQVALDMLRNDGACVTTVESVIFQLVHAAGTELFRRILPIVR